jgi:FtsP/CotA-like multicopper oxidase with cupredoxin domain
VETPLTPTPVTPTPDVPEAEPGAASSALSRRGFLRVAGLTGVAGVAASVAACTTAASPAWSFGAPATPAAPSTAPTPSPVPSAAAPSASASAAPSPSPSASPIPNLPAGWTEHDLNGQIKVRRFVGNLAGPLGMSPFLDNVLGPNTDKPEFTQLPQGNQPLEPTVDADGTKVFTMTIDDIEWPIDALNPPVKALGYNKMWPGPTIRVTEGDKVRFNFTNNLKEATGVHFHGMELTDFTQDGVPFVTQLPFAPGETFTYEFVANPSGSHMYHSHHNATDQVGRGLLGAFIVEPRKASERYPQKFGVDQEVVFIHNDALGGFTINGHGFPATTPIVAKQGDKVLIRFMNEGTMMHPWHTHGFRMNVVARDGAYLGSAAFKADTLGVNPGERWDAIINCDRPGVWAFHCHILPHVEGPDGMYGMVTALVILPPG